MLFAKFFCAKSKARCWSVRFKEWLDKKKKSKNISKSPENNAAWKVEDIDEFGQKPTDPDAQPMRNCNWSSRSHAEESKNSQQHLLKKKEKM